MDCESRGLRLHSKRKLASGKIGCCGGSFKICIRTIRVLFASGAKKLVPNQLTKQLEIAFRKECVNLKAF